MSSLESKMEKLCAKAQANQEDLKDEYRAAGSMKPTPRTKPPGSKPKPRDASGNYGISSDFEKKEYFDSEEILSEKVETLIQWLRESRHCLVFTGAGISTSTGIPDYRSGVNTVLATGPGKWEKRDKGILTKRGKQVQSVLKAFPSLSHMAIVKLQQEGIVKMVVSQNTDGLHRRSGLKPDVLAELHGNTNLEKCLKCGHKYMRDFRTRNVAAVHDHRTGRLCDDPKCRGPLADSIINFNEVLPGDELDKAFSHGRQADLCLVLGSSLRVFPAADIPGDMIKRGAKVVICNLQKTPFNKTCAMEIHTTIDTLMSKVMQGLSLEIPTFKLVRCFAVDVLASSVTIQGLDGNTGTPYSFFKEISIKVPNLGLSLQLQKEPFHVDFPCKVAPTADKPLSMVLTLSFQGHYQEPKLTVRHVISNLGRTVFLLQFDPASKQWNVEKK